MNLHHMNLLLAFHTGIVKEKDTTNSSQETSVGIIHFIHYCISAIKGIFRFGKIQVVT